MRFFFFDIGIFKGFWICIVNGRLVASIEAPHDIFQT